MKVLKLTEFINEDVYNPRLSKKERKMYRAFDCIDEDSTLNNVQKDALTHCVKGVYYDYEHDGKGKLVAVIPVTHETFKLLYANYDPDDLLTFVDNYLDEHGFEWCYPHNEDAVKSRHPRWNLKELNDACGI